MRWCHIYLKLNTTEICTILQWNNSLYKSNAVLFCVIDVTILFAFFNHHSCLPSATRKAWHFSVSCTFADQTSAISPDQVLTTLRFEEKKYFCHRQKCGTDKDNVHGCQRRCVAMKTFFLVLPSAARMHALEIGFLGEVCFDLLALFKIIWRRSLGSTRSNRLHIRAGILSQRGVRSVQLQQIERIHTFIPDMRKKKNCPRKSNVSHLQSSHDLSNVSTRPVTCVILCDACHCTWMCTGTNNQLRNLHGRVSDDPNLPSLQDLNRWRIQTCNWTECTPYWPQHSCSNVDQGFIAGVDIDTQNVKLDWLKKRAQSQRLREIRKFPKTWIDFEHLDVEYFHFEMSSVHFSWTPPHCKDGERLLG